MHQSQKADSVIQNTSDYIQGYPLGLQLYVSGSDSLLIIPTPKDVYSLKINQGSNHDWFDFGFSAPQQPFIGKYLILTHNKNLYSGNGSTQAWNYTNGNWQMVWNNNQISSSTGFISSEAGDTLDFDFGKDRININDGSSLSSFSQDVQRSKPVNGQYSYIQNKTFQIAGSNYVNSSWFQNSSTGQRLYTGSLIPDSQNTPAFFALDLNDLYLIEPQNGSPAVTTIVDHNPINWPAFADYNGDGNLDFIFIDKNHNTLVAKNLNGALLDGFPVKPPKGSKFVGLLS